MRNSLLATWVDLRHQILGRSSVMCVIRVYKWLNILRVQEINYNYKF